MLADAVVEKVKVSPNVEIAVTVLTWVPSAVPVTFTVNEQEMPPGRIREAEMALLLTSAVTLPKARHDPVTTLGADTKRPAGRVSLTDTESADVGFGLVMVKLAVVVPPRGTATAPKLLVIVAGPTTVRTAVAVFPVPTTPSLTVTLFVFTPTVEPTTSMPNWQLPPAARLPLNDTKVGTKRLKLTVPVLPAVHDPATLGTLATWTPLGKVSVKLTLVSVTAASGLVIVNWIVEIPFTAIVVGLNAFVTTGGVWATASDAVRAASTSKRF
jgi:hypothetical protein